MNRGAFDFFTNYSIYIESEKDWYIALDRSDCFWYELIVNPPDEFDTKKYALDYLKELQGAVETQLDKRFIYFLAARKKVRFSKAKKPKYSFFGSRLTLYVELGRERKLKKITTQVLDMQTGKPIKPAIEINDRFITFIFTPQSKVSIAVHDFLRNNAIELGISTEVHYVGYTKNPSERPINRAHRGLADTLYRVSNEEHDFFVYYNLFKVLSVASNQNAAVNFCLANSMIDEVKVDEEGRIIEKALIRYFQTESQEVNRQSEEKELENSLIKLAAKHKIKSLSVHIEMDTPNEYYRFFSRSIDPSDKHIFTCQLSGNSVEIEKGSTLFK